MISGIHHLTGISSNAQANYNFYANLLGLRLVKRTINHNDPLTLHLFYGDAIAAPGTLLTFFVWQGAERGRPGAGQATELGLQVPLAQIGAWIERFIQHSIPFEGPKKVGDQTHLTILDPDGQQIVLVGRSALPTGQPWAGSTVPRAMQIRGIHHTTFLTDQPAATGALLTQHLGFQGQGQISGRETYQAPTPAGHTVYLQDARGFWPAASGAGTLHHVAFRTPNLAQTEAALHTAGADELTAMREHGYFQSIYLRESGGSVIEVASEGPGFTLDEDIATLGSSLVLPPALESRRPEITAALPAIQLLGEEPFMTPDLQWIHRIIPGKSKQTLLLLHGTGGDENQLLDLGRQLAPEATLLSVRGRSLEEGAPRFFRRFSATAYDQPHLRAEAAALAQFVREATTAYQLDPTQVIALGYSNGANIALASLIHDPAPYAGAVLIRPVMAVEQPPTTDLHHRPVLVLHGQSDPFLPFGEPITPYLQAQNAAVQEERLPAGHELTDRDLVLIKAWLAEQAGPIGSA